MDDFFTRVPDAVWPRQGRLHIYAPLGDALRRTVAEYQDALGQDPADAYGIGLVPPEWLHATVQMLRTAADELDVTQHDELIAALRKHVAAVPPLTLTVGPPQASLHAVELWIAPDADGPWRWLVECVRTAVCEVLGTAALPTLGPNATPHTSIAYGVGAGDSGAAMSALKRTRLDAVSVPIEAVQLVSVTQHPGVGFFSWEQLAELPLAAADRAGVTA